MNRNLIYVVGPGGSGQTYFMQFLQQAGINTNSPGDEDKLKHLPSPNSPLLKDLPIERCFFIFNEPYKAIQSHLRRKWLHAQVDKLGNPYKLPSCDIDVIDKVNTLVLLNGRDVTGIDFQFNNWTNFPAPFPIMFLDFSKVIEKQNEISVFIGKKIDFTKFKYAERKTDFVENTEVQTIYDKLYADMIQTSQSYPLGVHLPLKAPERLQYVKPPPKPVVTADAKKIPISIPFLTNSPK